MINNLLALSIVAIALAAAYIALKLMRLSLHSLFLGVGGAIVGLLLSALLSVPLGKLPEPFGSILPIVATALLTIVMIAVFVRQQEHAEGLSSWLKSVGGGSAKHKQLAAATDEILVDTSVIIDGRIADIAQTGFVPGKLLVPRFVLAELQNIADSDDSMRRSRGRRGLEMLKNIQGTAGIHIEIIDDDVPTIREVDAKLVSLAQTRGSQIMTTDYNLNRVAQIEGIKVLNINELSNAIRPVVLPGEEMLVKIVQAGKERNQGVGYLPDGTMIVVENGDKMIGQEVPTEVTRVFQTVAGKMIFATPKKQTAQSGKNGRARNSSRGRQPQAQTNDSPQSIEDRLVQENHETA